MTSLAAVCGGMSKAKDHGEREGCGIAVPPAFDFPHQSSLKAPRFTTRNKDINKNVMLGVLYVLYMIVGSACLQPEPRASGNFGPRRRRADSEAEVAVTVM